TCAAHVHGETRKHPKNVLIISRLTIAPPPDKSVRNLFLVQDPRHPAQRKKGFRDCGNRKSSGRPMIMQCTQANVVSRTEQAAVLEIHNNDGEDAKDPLKSALAPMVKQTKRKHAVGHATQLALRNA